MIVRSGVFLLIVCFLSCCIVQQSVAQKSKPAFRIARPVIAGLHLAMSADSAELVLTKIAARRNLLKLDSLTLIESDSVVVFGEPAYLRVELLHGKLRTLVVNFHPSKGAERYLNLRNTLQTYMEQYFGRGVITKDQSVTFRRWQNDDGRMEVSFTDKYMRVFMRLGKW